MEKTAGRMPFGAQDKLALPVAGITSCGRGAQHAAPLHQPVV